MGSWWNFCCGAGERRTGRQIKGILIDFLLGVGGGFEEGNGEE
jgi:hypothetical protein